MAKQNEDSVTLAIKLVNEKQEIIKDISIKDCIQYLKKKKEDSGIALEREEKRLQVVREEIINDPDLVVDYHLLAESRAKTDAFLIDQFDGLSNQEVIKMVDNYHRYATLGSLILYDDYQTSGSARWCGVTWPNFKRWPYRFNDRASSAYAYGGNILFSRTWYRGRRLVLLAFPGLAFEDFREFGFDNVASSYASFL